MKLPRISVENYQFTSLLFVILLIIGLSSYFNMPRTENPSIFIPGASVVVIYPGASPTDLEQLVAFPIEDAINELDDIKDINITLIDGIASISVEFMFDTDAKEKYDEVVTKLAEIRNDLPDEIFDIRTNRWRSSDVAMMQLALISDSAEYNELNDKAEQLKQEIEKANGVKKVEILAIPEQEIRISLDLEKMAQMNITINQVANAIQSNNANIPGGSIDISGKNFSIKSSGAYSSLYEIRNTVVNSYEGRVIYLDNIADVRYDYEDLKYYARFSKHNQNYRESRRCIFMTVKQKDGLNIFSVADKIKPVIDSFKKELNGSFSLEYVFDQSIVVEERMSGFLGNLIQGIVLVGIVILLALGFRSSIIVIVAIPMSIVIGLSFVDMYGLALQQITIAGLVVALGLLVDNSIVMVENINRFLGMGFSPKEAAIKGASQIAWPVISSTATTLLAFVPIIMMPDKAGVFIKGLPVTIIATLSVSLFIALSLSPLIASRFFKGFASKEEAEASSNQKKGIEKYLSLFITGHYRRILNYSLNHKALIICLSVAALLISLSVAGLFIDKSFFPKAETAQFMVRVNMPEGTNLEKTDKATCFVESILDTIPEIKLYATNIGHGNPRIYYNLFPKNYARNFADIYVEGREYNVKKFDELLVNLRKIFSQYPGAEINIKEFEQGIPVSAPIVIYINGSEADVLKSISKDTERFLAASDGVVNIDNQLSKRRTDIYFNINKDKAGIFGVPVYEIDKTIRTAISGTTISKFRDKDGEEYNIVVRLDIDDKTKISDFDKIYVASVTGKLIPLEQLANYEFREAPGIITRFNQQRTAILTADLEKEASLDEVMKTVIEKLDNYDFPKGYDYYVGGEMESRSESFGGMNRAAIIAVIAIFAVLVLQFKSFKQPLIIFMAIPLGIIGSVWAIFLTGNTFSFTALIGFISLVGIVVNNSIILVDYTNQLRSEGHTITEALKEAGETRFTPIILTTLTTIGGLLPLTLRGGTLWAPMGWTIIGGLLVSTMLTLIVVPVFYKTLTK